MLTQKYQQAFNTLLIQVEVYQIGEKKLMKMVRHHYIYGVNEQVLCVNHRFILDIMVGSYNGLKEPVAH